MINPKIGYKPSDRAFLMEKLFNIYDKEGNLVPFRLNTIQQNIDYDIIQPYLHRTSILKYRQGGVTTIIMAWFLIECMMRHAVAVMLAHDKDHTEKLLQRAKFMLTNMNGAKPATSKLNENEILFSKTQSSFYIGTAGNVNFGRSATITHLHCSEIAFWKDPKTLLTGLHQAVPHKSGVIVQETTANGFGNWFQKQYYKYVAGEGRYVGFFYPWNIHEDYNSFTPLRGKSQDEEDLAKIYNLSDPQLQWRREKIDELEGDEDLFHQEYPLSYEEAFRSTGGSLFSSVGISSSKDWIVEDRNTWVLKGHPKEGLHYVLGADSAGGTGHDFSAIFGLCVETREQVLSYRDRKINPPAFGKVLRAFGKRFNTAYLVPESNSHGLSVLAIIKEDYPLLNIYRTLISRGAPSQTIQVPSYGYGWKTTSITKPYMVGIGQKFIDEGVKIYDPVTVDELLSFTETEEGKLEGSGDNDDSAIAFMLACMGYVKVVKFLARAEGTNVIFFEQEREAKRLQRLDPMKKYRDEEGRYLIPFEEIVKEKKRRLVG